MTLFTCAAVQRRLPAFHDRELPIPDLIEIEAHAAECARCADELREMRTLGQALRLVAAPGPADDWTGLRPGVISRMRAEAHESWRARIARMMDDLHLVWIGFTAATAACICGLLALGALQFSSSDRDDSLAALMAVISAPSGSDLNPVRSGTALQVPSVPLRGPIEVMLAQATSHDELEVALSAVVTREGRVADVAVLYSESHTGDLAPILDVLSRARLEPGRLGAAPVAVNLVWVLAHTTVRPEPQPRKI